MTLETPAEFSAELKDKLAQCGIALVFFATFTRLFFYRGHRL